MKWSDMDFTQKTFFIISLIIISILLFSLCWQVLECQDVGGLKTGGIAGVIAFLIIKLMKWHK